MEDDMLDRKALAFQGFSEYLEADLVERLLKTGQFEAYYEGFYDKLDQVPLHVAWKNKEGRYLGCVRSFFEIAQLSHREEIIGKTDEDLLWKNDFNAFKSAESFALEYEKGTMFDMRFLDPQTGHYQYWEVNHKANYYESGKFRCITVYLMPLVCEKRRKKVDLGMPSLEELRILIKGLKGVENNIFRIYSEIEFISGCSEGQIKPILLKEEQGAIDEYILGLRSHLISILNITHQQRLDFQNKQHKQELLAPWQEIAEIIC